MKFYYDFHIHTCLSPCGDDDMTPMNIANMSQLLGLNIIAVTDHNSVGNALAVTQAAKQCGLTVLSGMELETAENAHILMIFPSFDKAKLFGDYVAERMFKIKNKTEIYGHQVYMNSDDEVVGEEENLLVVATDIGVYETVELADKFGGVAIPAHIDKPSNGIIAILGQIDEDMGFNTVEFSPHASEELKASYSERGYMILTDSDSHYLDTINQNTDNYLELEYLSARAVIDLLKNNIRRKK